MATAKPVRPVDYGKALEDFSPNDDITITTVEPALDAGHTCVNVCSHCYTLTAFSIFAIFNSLKLFKIYLITANGNCEIFSKINSQGWLAEFCRAADSAVKQAAVLEKAALLLK